MKRLVIVLAFLPFLTFSQHFTSSDFSDSTTNDVKSRYLLSLTGDFVVDHVLDITLFQVDAGDTSDVLYTTIDFNDIDPEDVETWAYVNGHLDVSLGEFLTGTYYLLLSLKDDNGLVVEELLLD